MLFTPDNLPYVRNVFIVLTIFMIGCAVHAYRANARLPLDDPKKREFHIGAVFLAPVTWLLFLLASVTIFILRAVSYILFLMLFTIAVLVIRKPFLLIWLDKIATKVGNKLLEANTILIQAFFGKTFNSPQP